MATLIKRGAKGAAVVEIQNALRAAGHELVPDGDFGPITERAVKMFQAAHGLEVDGIVGPKTAAALVADKESEVGKTIAAKPVASSVLGVAPWLSSLRALTGTQEIPGAKSNPLILSWVAEIIKTYPDLKPNLGWYVNDDTPWCGLAVAYVVAKAGHKPPLAPLYALNWRTWGVPVQRCPGAILVFKRPGGGHVGLYEGEDATAYHVRGGNQSNRINVTRIAKGRCVGARWPAGHPLPSGGAVQKSASGKLSSNEA